MKRFHVHAHVTDLGASISFYVKLFGAEPTRVEADYAKWMLDDPRINFAISTRGTAVGVDHLGFQVDDASELAELKARAQAADMAMLDEGETTCCYARSDKHWVTDPQGIAWEHFQSLENIPVFREAAPATGTASSVSTPASSQGNAGPPQVSLTPTGGGLGAARPWARSVAGMDAAASASAASPASPATPPAVGGACCGPSKAAAAVPASAARCC
jgi:catechol 2,3-dioxygenase-like lactoylglutathione lyase family enzyme